MDELRLIRRDEQSLIVANEAGNEFCLVVDANVLAEIRQISRRERDAPRVSPRDIQRLVRGGKSRAEIIAITGAEESDIVRYEEPVLAERRFILSSAQSVGVRTTAADSSEQEFGEVMNERLSHLNAEAIDWTAWKDDAAGWMIGLEFISHDVAHNAVWAFDHRKSQLSPTTPDAVTLSRQGEVGARLIPKLRAVEPRETRSRFETPFDPDALTEGLYPTAEITPIHSVTHNGKSETLTQESPLPQVELESKKHKNHDTQSPADPQAEFLRRREIDQRSMSTPPGHEADLSETSDLLDALRKRRVARENEAEIRPDSKAPQASRTTTQLFPAEHVGAQSLSNDHPVPAPAGDGESLHLSSKPHPTVEQETIETEIDLARKTTADTQPSDKPKKSRGRSAIPSWDDILFGTRSEEDPSL